MTYKVTLVKRDDPAAELSTGIAVTMYSDELAGLMDDTLLRSLLEGIVKDGVDIHIDPAKLIVEYRWE